MKVPEILTTPRLRLRPFHPADIDDVLAYATDPQWARFLPVPQPYSRTDAQEFLARHVSGRQASPSWAIEHRQTVIGGIDLRLYWDDHVGEIGYAIARRLWGHGFATEAARVVVDAGFESIPTLQRIRALSDPRNLPSRRVLEKLGMVREGLLRWNRWVHGEPVDDAWYGLLRPEWEARRFGGGAPATDPA